MWALAEVTVGRRVKAVRVIGRDIDRTGREQHRFSQINLLPAADCLIREGGLPKECPLSAPEAADVGTCVQRPFIEADPR